MLRSHVPLILASISPFSTFFGYAIVDFRHSFSLLAFWTQSVAFACCSFLLLSAPLLCIFPSILSGTRSLCSSTLLVDAAATPQISFSPPTRPPITATVARARRSRFRRSGERRRHRAHRQGRAHAAARASHRRRAGCTDAHCSFN
eukprot:3621508-Pleurochrysis_carterae.AAC.1